MRQAGGPHRSRAEGADQSEIVVRPQELFLSRPAPGLSDQSVQGTGGRGGRGRARYARWRCRDGRHRTPSSGTGRRQIAARPTSRHVAGRSEPRRRGAHGDCVEAGPALLGRGKTYVAKLRSILRYLGTCDGDMEKGNLRADVNVSVRPAGEQKLGTRCEIKNVNSIRFIGQAVEAEARRQIDILEDGGTIEQETRLFDSAKGVTRSMRSKEEAHDYRYFPDPDLLPLELTQEYVDGLQKGLPELPDAKRERFMKANGLS